jgi:hypothetical protein
MRPLEDAEPRLEVDRIIDWADGESQCMVSARGSSDSRLEAVGKALVKYGKQHQNAEVVVHRLSSAFIRARIAAPDFAGLSKADGHDFVWGFPADLQEDRQSQASVRLLWTPDEVDKSFANVESDNPTPSRL